MSQPRLVCTYGRVYLPRSRAWACLLEQPFHSCKLLCKIWGVGKKKTTFFHYICSCLQDLKYRQDNRSEFAGRQEVWQDLCHTSRACTSITLISSTSVQWCQCPHLMYKTTVGRFVQTRANNAEQELALLRVGVTALDLPQPSFLC